MAQAGWRGLVEWLVFGLAWAETVWVADPDAIPLPTLSAASIVLKTLPATAITLETL